MELKNKLMQKIGIMSTNLAIEFIQLDVGDRIPIISELSEKYNIARGTVQSSLKILQDYGSIKLESRGHLGTFITFIDHLKLLEIAGINSIVGVMPLPYSKRYEGLATGIFNTLNDEGLSANIAFMRGANHRLKFLKDKRYDFAVTSRLTADYYIKNKEPIKIVSAFGDYSYVNEHVMMVSDDFDGSFNHKMKIGIDKSSIDQATLTLLYFDDYQVDYVNMPYNSLKSGIKSKKIDAAIWNKDDIKNNEVKSLDIKCRENIGISDTEAVIIVNKENIIIPKLFSKKLDKNKVLKLQKEVIEEKIMPNY